MENEKTKEIDLGRMFGPVDCEVEADGGIVVGDGPDVLTCESIGDGDWAKAPRISIPPSVREIEFRALAANDEIEEISVPDTVETLGDEAFADDSRLKAVYVPRSVKNVGIYSFSGSPNVVVCCGHGEKPENWPDEWNLNRDGTRAAVVWGSPR